MWIFGTQNFIAPELMKEDSPCTNRADVYWFCVEVFYILTKGRIQKISNVDIWNGKICHISLSLTAGHFKLNDDVEKKINQIESFLSNWFKQIWLKLTSKKSFHFQKRKTQSRCLYHTILWQLRSSLFLND